MPLNIKLITTDNSEYFGGVCIFRFIEQMQDTEKVANEKFDIIVPNSMTKVEVEKYKNSYLGWI